MSYKIVVSIYSLIIWIPINYIFMPMHLYFLKFVNPMETQCYLFLALIYILLITSEVEHYFIILLPNIIFCSVKCLLFCLFSQVFEEFLYVFIYSGHQLLIKNALQSFLTIRACLVVSHRVLLMSKTPQF